MEFVDHVATPISPARSKPRKPPSIPGAIKQKSPREKLDLPD
jgi:hypothetical protein